MEKLSKLKFGNLPQLTDEEMKLVVGACGGGSGYSTYVCLEWNGGSYNCYRGSTPSGSHCNCEIAYQQCGSL